MFFRNHSRKWLLAWMAAALILLGFSQAWSLLRNAGTGDAAEAIAAVPEGMREVFLLRDVHGLSVEETAQALQIAQGTVKSRLARAREKIAAELKRRGVGQTGGERHAV